jgi:hypothetical protein
MEQLTEVTQYAADKVYAVYSRHGIVATEELDTFQEALDYLKTGHEFGDLFPLFILKEARIVTPIKLETFNVFDLKKVIADAHIKDYEQLGLIAF